MLRVTINNGDRVLFIGDSITDALRNKNEEQDLGKGFVLMAAAGYAAAYPHKEVEFVNRGISGNRIKDLKARWDRDCLKVKPDVVSILIGVNDCWRRYDKNDPVSAHQFEQDFGEILEKTKSSLDAKIILCEPFVLPYPEDRKSWREDLDPKIAVTRNLALEFGAAFIPFDGIFAKACTQKPVHKWAADGVHPTVAGHGLMAKSWLEAVD